MSVNKYKRLRELAVLIAEARAEGDEESVFDYEDEIEEIELELEEEAAREWDDHHKDFR